MNYVIKKIKTADLQNAIDSTNVLYKTLQGDGVMMLQENKSGIRVMAEGREGYVRLISKIAEQNNEALSKMDDASELLSSLDYDADLESLRQSLLKLLELISETQWGNSADIMVMADRYNQNLQTARKGKSSLDAAMREVDEWNAKFGPVNALPSKDEKDEEQKKDSVATNPE